VSEVRGRIDALSGSNAEYHIDPVVVHVARGLSLSGGEGEECGRTEPFSVFDSFAPRIVHYRIYSFVLLISVAGRREAPRWESQSLPNCHNDIQCVCVEQNLSEWLNQLYISFGEYLRNTMRNPPERYCTHFKSKTMASHVHHASVYSSSQNVGSSLAVIGGSLS
jgi:hypothetical protein